MNVIRGIEKPAAGQSWQEAVFRKMAEANPFPALMGRTCPAVCEGKCNRNDVEDHVGINAIEHYIGDWALANGLKFRNPRRRRPEGGGGGGRPGRAVVRLPVAPAGSFAGGVRGERPVGRHAALWAVGAPLPARPGGRRDRPAAGDGDRGSGEHAGRRGRDDRGAGGGIRRHLLGDRGVVGQPGAGPRVGQGGQLRGRPGLPASLQRGAAAVPDGTHADHRGWQHGDGLRRSEPPSWPVEGRHRSKRLPEKVVAGQVEHAETPVSARGAADVWIVYRRPFAAAPADQHEKDAGDRRGGGDP